MDATVIATAVISAIVSGGGVQLIQAGLTHRRSTRNDEHRHEDSRDERAFKVLETRVDKLDEELKDSRRKHDDELKDCHRKHDECQEQHAVLQNKLGRLELAVEQSGILRSNPKPPSA